MDITTQNQDQKVDQLIKSAKLVMYFYEDLKDIKDAKRDYLPITFFRALAALTLFQAEQGVALENIKFTAKELRDKILEIGSLTKSKQSDSEWVRENWNKLEEDLEQRKNHLQVLSKKKGEEFYPWIEKDESKGGQGNRSYYYLIARSFNQQDITEIIQYPCPGGESLFLRKIFPGFLLEKSAKKYATANAFGCPDSSSSPRLDPTRGRNIGSK